jgi:hypothetical protein
MSRPLQDDVEVAGKSGLAPGTPQLLDSRAQLGRRGIAVEVLEVQPGHDRVLLGVGPLDITGRTTGEEARGDLGFGGMCRVAPRAGVLAGDQERTAVEGRIARCLAGE